MDSVMLHDQRELRIFTLPVNVFEAAAEDFTQRANAAVSKKGSFTVVLSGGNTPKDFFSCLTSEHYLNRIPWERIQFFFGDERYVPATDKASNYHMACEYLFSKTPVLSKNIYPISTDIKNPVEAAGSYASLLREVLNVKQDECPIFDLVYLGLGDNAHTASLMPLSDVVIKYAKLMAENINAYDNELVVALWVEALNMYRITLTPTTINNSRCITFLVTGENKAQALSHVLQGPVNPEQYPAQLIRCLNGNTIWYVDNAAAEHLGAPIG